MNGHRTGTTVRNAKRALFVVASSLTWFWAYPGAEEDSNPLVKLSGNCTVYGTVMLKVGRVK